MAYMKKSSKKKMGGKKMKAGGNYLEPSKEIKFGGVKKMQSAGERRRREQQEETTRNSPNNPGGRAGTPVGTYAGAKAKDPKLDMYIKKRKQHPKGSKEYNYYQNRINKAYGKGPTDRPEQRPGSFDGQSTTSGRPGVGRPTNQSREQGRDPQRRAPMTPVQKKEPKPVPTNRPKPELKKPVAPKPATPAPAPEKAKKSRGDRLRDRADRADQRMTDRRNRRAGRQADRAAKRKPNTTAASKISAGDMKKLDKDLNRPMKAGGMKKMGMGGYGKMMSYTAGGKKKNAKGSFPDLTGDGKVTRADVLKGRGVFKKGGKKGGGMSGLSAAQKEVYRRGLAAYMSSGNRPKVSQHAWAMARVKSAFGKREAAKIRSGKGKKKK